MQLLLERLAAPARHHDVASAVQAQVQRLVAIHVWEGDTGLHLMDMGVPALADVNSPTGLGQLSARLHALIARNEPRLDVQRVDVVMPGPGAAGPPHLLVVARLDREDDVRTLHFDLPNR